MPMTAEQCVAFLRDALTRRPVDTYSDDALEWYADVTGAVSAYDALAAVQLRALLHRVSDITAGVSGPVMANRRQAACSEFVVEARSIYTQLRLTTNSFSTAQVAAGAVYDYFEEIRQLIAAAAGDVLFIDPYIDATFVTRYLPQTPQGVTVRLLTAERQAAALRQALNMFQQQHGTAVELRVVPNPSLHDRHLVIDRRDAYQSGASFKDGARNAPTSINQIADVAADLIRAHEANWAAARVVA